MKVFLLTLLFVAQAFCQVSDPNTVMIVIPDTSSLWEI